MGSLTDCCLFSPVVGAGELCLRHVPRQRGAAGVRLARARLRGRSAQILQLQLRHLATVCHQLEFPHPGC